MDREPHVWPVSVRSYLLPKRKTNQPNKKNQTKHKSQITITDLILSPGEKLSITFMFFAFILQTK